MVYEGIFVKEFTLFYGDHHKYPGHEEWDQKTKESEMLEKNYQDINLSHGSRYDLLNQMSKAFLEKKSRRMRVCGSSVLKGGRLWRTIFSGCCEEKKNK